MEWKNNSKPAFSCIRVHETETCMSGNLEEVLDTGQQQLDIDFFLSNVVKLVNDGKTDLIIEIDKQLMSVNISHYPIVMNSILPSYLFYFIKNFQSFPREFLRPCLNICANITLLSKENFSKFINPNFVKSLFSLIKQEDSMLLSLWIMANTFCINEEVFNLFRNGMSDILNGLNQSQDPKLISLYSLIIKRSVSFINYAEFDEMLVHATNVLQKGIPFAQVKILQMIAKYIKNFENDKQLSFLFQTIKYNTHMNDLLIFGHTLYIILSFFSEFEDRNISLIMKFIQNIPIWDILKCGLESNNSLIQSASADILCVVINNIPLFSADVVNSDLIKTIFQMADISEYKGKEKVQKVLIDLFYRLDLSPSFDCIFKFGGMQFLCDTFMSTKNGQKELFKVFNRISIIYPQLSAELIQNGIIEQLDGIIFGSDNQDSSLVLSAQALKDDLLFSAAENKFPNLDL